MASITIVCEYMLCPRCHGEGYQEYDEDGRTVKDACYHCGTTGKVDPDSYFHDQLLGVANTLARQEEAEYRQWRDSDPDGDGYDLCAAENLMHTNDYFNLRVWDRSIDIAEKLAGMSREDQELMIAWNELPYQQPEIIIRDTLPAPAPIHISEGIDDGICF